MGVAQAGAAGCALVAEPAPMFMPLQVATDLPAPLPRADAAPAVPSAPSRPPLAGSRLRCPTAR